MIMTAQRSAVPYSIVRVIRLANDRAHRRGEKAEVHHGDGDFVAVEHSIAADHGIVRVR